MSARLSALDLLEELLSTVTELKIAVVERGRPRLVRVLRDLILKPPAAFTEG